MNFCDSIHVLALGEALAIGPREVAGLVSRLWCKLAAFAPNADLSMVPDAIVEVWCASPPREKGKLVPALMATGWMTKDRVVTGFYDRHSEILKRRERDSEMKRARRSVRADRLRTARGQTADGVRTDCGRRNPARPPALAREESREEKSNNIPPTPQGGEAPSAPASEASPVGGESKPARRKRTISPVNAEIPRDLVIYDQPLKAWLRYKAERKQSYTPTGLETVWARARKIGPQLPEAIETAIACNWAGFFEPKGAAAPQRQLDSEEREERERARFHTIEAGWSAIPREDWPPQSPHVLSRCSKALAALEGDALKAAARDWALKEAVRQAADRQGCAS